jgi:hypothetical protein
MYSRWRDVGIYVKEQKKEPPPAFVGEQRPTLTQPVKRRLETQVWNRHELINPSFLY